MTKYAKFEQMAHEMLLTEDKAIPRIASSKSSDQKDSRRLLTPARYCAAQENDIKGWSISKCGWFEQPN